MPASLLFSLLAVPIIIFYMLKLRRREVEVSSVLLWRQVLRDREANAPWQRLRRNLLLLLQLLILALLVLALARPYFQVAAQVEGNVVLLLDASASMQATDVSPSRFAAAKKVCRKMIDDLGPGDAMTLIAVGNVPRVLASATGDKAILRQALDEAQVTSSVADVKAALILAAAGAKRSPRFSVVVVSDGAVPPELPSLPVAVHFVVVGNSGYNQALSALAVRDGRSGPELFLRASNHADNATQALVEVEIDGHLFDAREVNLPPHGEVSLTLADLPPQTSLVEARLNADDVLALDNTAWAVRTPPEPGRVLLVSPGNLFLERALGLLPHVTLFKAGPDVPLPGEAFGLYVFDGALPGEWPPGNLLIIEPPRSTDLFAVQGVITQTAISRVEMEHPLLRHVDLRGLHVASARRVEPPPWGRVLVEAEGGPLLWAGESQGRKAAMLTFDLHRSDLPLQIAFPILISNLVSWFLPRGALELPAQMLPGEPLVIRPEPQTQEVIVETPDGRRLSLPFTGQPLSFADTGRVGMYTVRQSTTEGEIVGRFAVNLFSELESNLAPRDRLVVGQTVVTAGQGQARGQREVWWPLALLSFVVLLVEWWVHFRPQIPREGWLGRILRRE